MKGKTYYSLFGWRDYREGTDAVCRLNLTEEEKDKVLQTTKTNFHTMLKHIGKVIAYKPKREVIIKYEFEEVK